MKCEAFQVRIGCILPTVFDADVEGYGHNQLSVEEAKGISAAIHNQCKLLRDEVECSTNGKITVCCKWHLPDTVVTRIRTLQTKERQHEIAQPEPKLWTQASTLKGAMAFFIWIPFEMDLYTRFRGVQRDAHMNRKTHFIWLPCTAQEEIDRSDRSELRSGVSHELKEWFEHSAAKGTGISMPNANTSKDFWGALKERLSSTDIKSLCEKYHRDNEAW